MITCYNVGVCSVCTCTKKVTNMMSMVNTGTLYLELTGRYLELTCRWYYFNNGYWVEHSEYLHKYKSVQWKYLNVEKNAHLLKPRIDYLPWITNDSPHNDSLQLNNDSPHNDSLQLNNDSPQNDSLQFFLLWLYFDNIKINNKYD